MRIGLVHPGEMGASVGAAAVTAGNEVWWASVGRSRASRRRAEEAGIGDAATLARLLARTEMVLGVVPPHAAVDIAERVAGLGFTGTYVDANAIAPETARRIGDVVTAAGGSFVDGGIIGGPVGGPGGTRLYLAGRAARTVAGAFDGSRLQTVVLPGDAGAASALKACYGGWTKGIGALALTLRALARAEGVEPALLDECARSLPELPGLTERAARAAAGKGWRWTGEMDQVAAALAAHDLPTGFHHAAADTYRRVGHPSTDTVDAIIGLITLNDRPDRPDRAG